MHKSVASPFKRCMNGYIYNFYICVCEHSLQLHFIIFPHKHRKKLAICGNETEKSGSNPYSKVMRNTEYTIHKTLHAVCFCMRSLSFLHIFGSKYSLLCKWDKNATQTIFSLRNLIVNFFFFAPFAIRIALNLYECICSALKRLQR